MSILFIGERNPIYYSPQVSANDASEQQRERKVRQERYRLDLLEQIREKDERKHRQKEKDVEYERRFLTKFRRGTPETVSTLTHNRQEGNYHFASQPKSQFSDYSSPAPKPTANIFSPNYDFSHLNTQNRGRRTKTENLQAKDSFQEFVDSFEKRQQELRDYENRRIGEVYEKMYSSVEANEDEDTEQVKSRLKPIKLAFDNKKYRGKLASRAADNPESSDYYKLPPIIRYNNPSELFENSNWREWYAKQKLKELEGYYKKVVDSQSQQHRVPTPSFQRSRN